MEDLKLTCQSFFLEDDRLRIDFLQVGFLDKVGIVWLRFELSEFSAKDSSTISITRTAGQTHPQMIKSAMVFG